MKVSTIVTAAAGLAASDIAAKIDIDQMLNSVVQILIGVVTIWKLFKKDKVPDRENQNLQSYTDDQRTQDKFP